MKWPQHQGAVSRRALSAFQLLNVVTLKQHSCLKRLEFVERRILFLPLCFTPLTLPLMLKTFPSFFLTVCFLNTLLHFIPDFSTSISVFLAAKGFMAAGCDLTPPIFSTTQKNVIFFFFFIFLREAIKFPHPHRLLEKFNTRMRSFKFYHSFSPEPCLSISASDSYCETLCASVFWSLFAAIKSPKCITVYSTFIFT